MDATSNETMTHTGWQTTCVFVWERELKNQVKRSSAARRKLAAEITAVSEAATHTQRDTSLPKFTQSDGNSEILMQNGARNLSFDGK